MGIWSHIIVEGYCMHNVFSKENLKTVKINGKQKKEYKEIKNFMYKPNAVRPAWCIKKNKNFTPQYKCLECGCKFFEYINADKKDYKLFNAVYKSFMDKQLEKIKLEM
jgi:hypothetical protein